MSRKGDCYDNALIEINRKQSKLTWDYRVIPKGSPNAQNAQKFIEFATHAERQAALAQIWLEGPTNRNAFKLLSENVAGKVPSRSDYMTSSIPIDARWYGQRGSGGKMNVERLRELWNEWILN
ncbi:spermidine/putrescine-binding protein [Bradyrhizobium sp. USDA 4518]